MASEGKQEGPATEGRVSLNTAKKAVLATAFEALEKCEEGTVDKDQLVEVLERFQRVGKDDSEKKSSGLTGRDMSFRSLLDHPEAFDGLDGVDIRKPTSPPLELSEGVTTRLLSQLKAIEEHVRESKNVSHLCKITRKLDVVLEACGIHMKDVEQKMNNLRKPKSYVDSSRFMHVGGSSLIFFCDTSGQSEGVTGIEAVDNKMETILKERVGQIDENEHKQIMEGGANTKIISRKGFHPNLRPKVWRQMLLPEDFDPISKEAEFHALEKEIWHGHVPEFDELEHHVHVPDFGGPPKLFHSHPITEQGEAAVQRLLCILQYTHPDVVYCPFLPDLCSVLVLHMPEWEVYFMVDAMIERSKTDEWFFPLSGERFMCYVESFLLLLHLRNKPLAKHVEKLQIPMFEEIEVWFARMFVGFVAYDLVIRIIDCFLSEGGKMFFRVGLALLKMHEKELLSCTNKLQFLKRFAKRMRMDTPVEDLLVEAFNIRGFSRKMLSKLHATHEIQKIPFAKVPVFYMPQFKAQDSKLLSVTHLRKLWKHLPILMRIQDPVLLFTTETHGYNLDVLLDRTGHQSAFIIIKTVTKSIFGVFLHWHENLRKHEIGEESFVFTLVPKLSVHHYVYSDPNRWGEKKGSEIPEASGLELRKAMSSGEQQDKKTVKAPPLQRTQSDQEKFLIVHHPPRRTRRSSEKRSAKTEEKPTSRSVSASSAPSSPVRQMSQELHRQMELKQTKPKDLGNWRARREEEEEKNQAGGEQGGKQTMLAPTQAATATGRGSDQSDSDAYPNKETRRRGNQLRMMDILSGNEISLWCRRTPQWFGIGTGDRVALGIDHRLHHGVTESTIAFNNPPLNGEKYHGDFKVTAIEVWGLTH
eukprot:CAMPEP_0114500456 /NCGR_PEP_ID=MMETSP0109-20121206/7973_1 /TAXON_ID=29199 /ORGANISM="Chlorarachnion reptans, Strain CCCM449" /LENGTH=866 /DNA_ID=CAMNT_0001678117 /DNA_START=30 /DNA_END=2630 /DNA_ORIENTATION=+